MPSSDGEGNSARDTRPRDSQGWDGKLRIGELEGGKRAVLANPEAFSDPDYSDPEAPPADVIEADEDLLEGYESDTEDIDLVHCRIGSIPALKLERFPKVERLCLRQNQISSISLPPIPTSNLKELDLYDNLVSHMRGLDDLSEKLETLDLSFNKIKHIKNVSHLKNLKNLYLVQNKISKIEGLDELGKLKMLELAANRLREIENLESLTSLEELWLGKNKITELKNISTLKSLRILSLPSNRLTSLSNLPSLPHLTDLYISHNLLSGPSALSPLSSSSNPVPSLRVLDISSNTISSLSGISSLTHLEEFWASDNDLSDWKEIDDYLSDKQELKTVYFQGNPLEKRGPAVYRNKLRLALPQVVQIDATYVR